jgi:hypothetical protein
MQQAVWLISNMKLRMNYGHKSKALRGKFLATPKSKGATNGLRPFKFVFEEMETILMKEHLYSWRKNTLQLIWLSRFVWVQSGSQKFQNLTGQ